MRLDRILSEVSGATLVQGDRSIEIAGVTHDSRLVRPGDLFLIVRGERYDARAFIHDALARGAAGVVAEAPLTVPGEVASIRVPSARGALADISAALRGHPSRKLRLVGVTGTDGKTTTIQLLSAILDRAGIKTGWLTTVDVKVGERRLQNDLLHTTPESDRVQEVLGEMVDAGVECVMLEVSSHALAMDRVRCCSFDAAIFTNLSPEHLNFHGTMDAYLSAKARLFGMLGEPSYKDGHRFGVLNADDEASASIRAHCPVPTVTYGVSAPADLTARDIELGPGGTRFTLVGAAGEMQVATRLIGRFNVANWLAAAAAAFELGADPSHVAEAAEQTAPVTGRMERVELGQPFLVVVDFAHTPQALQNALETLRPHTPGRLMVVFGHAGERDPANRPAMGSVAARHSDFFALSADDPLHEDPREIAEEIAAGATPLGKRAGVDFVIEIDRAGAIRELVGRACSGDTVLLAGKGHERRMLVGDDRLPWSDREEAKRALAELGYGVSSV